MYVNKTEFNTSTYQNTFHNTENFCTRYLLFLLIINKTFFLFQSDQNLELGGWLPIFQDEINSNVAQRRSSDVFDGEIRETRSLKERSREGREGSSESAPLDESSTYFIPQGSQKKRQVSRNENSKSFDSQKSVQNKDFDLSQEAGSGPDKNNQERDSKMF